MPPDRLTPLDASFLRLEPQHLSIGTLVLDPPAHGDRPDLHALRAFVASRLGRQRRYRQRLAYVPDGLGLPVWVDDTHFDLDRHVRRAGDGELSLRALGDLVGRLSTEPFDEAHPLWRIDLIERLEGGRLALVVTAHHALADGLAMLVFFGTLLADVVPDPVPDAPEGALWEPDPPPSDEELVRDALAERESVRTRLARTATGVTSTERWHDAGHHLATARGRAGRMRSLVRRGTAQRVRPAAFNVPATIEAGARVAFWARHLDELRRIEHEIGHPTTLNDVALAATAGGLRRWLIDTGQPVVDLRVLVPVAVADAADAGASNQASRMFVLLPVTEADALERVRAVTRQVTAAKARGDARTEADLKHVVNRLPRRVRRRVVPWLSANAWSFNLVVSDVPGPTVQLYVLGCPVADIYPMSSLSGNDGMVLTLISSENRLGFSLLAHGTAVPDPHAIAAAIEAAFDELARLYS